jgi:hypothetical protein
MNLGLAKELRALILPWSVALVIAFLIPLANFFFALHFIEGAFFMFLFMIVTFTFFGVLLAIAALPFGSEFQHRTFPLLLSQPIRRSRLWQQKLMAASIALASSILVLTVAQWIAQAAANFIIQTRGGEVGKLNAPWEMVLSCCALLLPTLGSVGFWTLLCRSTLGGMVFTAFAQLIVLGLFAFVVEQFDKSDTDLVFFAVVGIIYGAIFFLLSWRKFSHLELGSLSTDAQAGSESLFVGLRLNWLRCASANGLANLIRKEFRLQMPIFVIAAILCAFWVLIYLLLILQPSRQTIPEIIFALTIGAYIPLIALLAGCLSLGEGKNLGITAWHLTFPVSIRRQWAVRFAVGFVTWLCLGLVFPFLLTSLGLAIGKTLRSAEVESVGWLTIALGGSFLFVTSFWAITLTTNAIRAVIGSLAIFAAVCSSAALAIWTVTLLFGTFAIFGLYAYLLSVLLVILPVFLAQSLRQYRSLQSSPGIALKHSAILVALTFVVVLACFLLLCVFGLRDIKLA